MKGLCGGEKLLGGWGGPAVHLIQTEANKPNDGMIFSWCFQVCNEEALTQEVCSVVLKAEVPEE